MSNSFCEKVHPSSIYTRFNTRSVIPLFSYTDALFEWSQMKIIKLEYPICWYETIFHVYCCLSFPYFLLGTRQDSTDLLAVLILLIWGTHWPTSRYSSIIARPLDRLMPHNPYNFRGGVHVSLLCPPSTCVCMCVVNAGGCVIDLLVQGWAWNHKLFTVGPDWKLSQAPTNVNFPRIARAQSSWSFKLIWNVRAVFIGWTIYTKKSCVKTHIVWHAIKIYN